MIFRSIIIRYFSVILFVSFIAGCAKISSPTGGPRDKTAPVVVKCIPANGTKNFRGNRIAVTFNEYVALDKINEKFMVSPPMKKKPRVFLKGKSVIIDFDEKLKDSTTYTFYFQDAIRDLNEGNIIDNFQFVLSTGPVLDSLSVTGNVYEAFTLDPPEDALVLLYRNQADSAFMKLLPDYISKTDKNGYFRINNVRNGRYRLYALVDADNSKNFNLPDEMVSFLDKPVDVSSSRNYIPVVKDTVKASSKKIIKADTTVKRGEYKLYLFQPEKKNHYLTSSPRNTQYKLTYTLSLPPDSGKFDFSIPGYQGKGYFREENKTRDTIIIWLTDTALYKKQQLKTLIGYPFTDSTGKVIQKKDTVAMRFLTPRTTRTRPRKESLKVISDIQSGFLKPMQGIGFKSPAPFKEPDTSRIRVYETDRGKRTRIPFSMAISKTNSCLIVLNTKLDQEKNYLVTTDTMAFATIYGDVSDSTGYGFTVKGRNAFGTLTLNMLNYQGKRIIQLLTNDEKIIEERIIDKDSKINFNYLDQGKYKLRVIYDLNNDGRWTSGDFLTRKQPEPVSFYDQELQVKEGWSLDQDWDTGIPNVKKLRKPAGSK